MRQMKDVRNEIVPLIKDVCMELTGHAYDNEVRLLLGTAAAESVLIHRVQIGGGPARGIWQMEYDTAYDIFVNYLAHRVISRFQNLSQLWLELSLTFFVPFPEEFAHHLEHYDDFACAMARIHYLRDPERIPERLEDQAAYWKRAYNTLAGKGTVEHYLGMWESCRCEELLRK